MKLGRSSFMIVGIAVMCFAVGAVGGWLFSNWRSDRDSQVQVLLYGEEREAQETAKRALRSAQPLLDAIGQMLTDYRNRAPISPERKRLLLSCLYQSSIVQETPQVIALGAVQDASPEVRLTCIFTLRQWLGAFAESLRMVTLNMKLERDGKVQAAKMALLQEHQVTRGADAPKPEGAETSH